MSQLPPSRYHFEATEGERIAYGLVHGAFAQVRALESQATFGVDLYDAEGRAHAVPVPRSLGDVDDAMAFLKNRKRRRERTPLDDPGYGPSPVAPDDTQGEQKIGYDDAAFAAMQQVAATEQVMLLGEEDEYRPLPDGNIQRGRRLRLLLDHAPIAIVDPLDGSNQAAGMGQRSGWACCAMVHLPKNPQLSVAILLGDGRGFTSFGGILPDGSDGAVWLSESSHPDRPSPSYRLDPLRSATATFRREHFIIPANKRSTIKRAQRILRKDEKITWLSPLAGNPGILAGMLCAGGVAAVQPRAYAWDHMALLMLATAGFPVIGENGDAPLTVLDLGTMFLSDMAAGRKTQSLYVGRTREYALRLREADTFSDSAEDNENIEASNADRT